MQWTSRVSKSLNQEVEVLWNTSEEEGMSHFVVERSSDGTLFSRIGIVSPDSTNLGMYAFVDSTVAYRPSSRWYYRIQQVDVQGNFVYSEVVEVEGKPNTSRLTLAPNPCRHDLSIRLPYERKTKGILRILNMQGKVLSSQMIEPTIRRISLPMETYAPGTYLIQLVSGDTVWGEMVRKQ